MSKKHQHQMTIFIHFSSGMFFQLKNFSVEECVFLQINSTVNGTGSVDSVRTCARTSFAPTWIGATRAAGARLGPKGWKTMTNPKVSKGPNKNKIKIPQKKDIKLSRNVDFFGFFLNKNHLKKTTGERCLSGSSHQFPEVSEDAVDFVKSSGRSSDRFCSSFFFSS